MAQRPRIYYNNPAQRAEIWDRWQRGESMSSIGRVFDRASSSIFPLLEPTGGCYSYRAAQSDQAAWDRAHRPKIRKLASSRYSAKVVELKLKKHWLPQQIAGWLKKKYPTKDKHQVSHESIYRTLYVQARGALKKKSFKLTYARNELFGVQNTLV